MIKSMTGFGLGTYSNQDLEIRIETKSLNSKYADINMRYPRSLSEKELEIRNILSSRLSRGKINVSIDVQLLGVAETSQQYNEELFIKYYQKLKRLADRVIASDHDLFRLALAAPDVTMTAQENETDPEVWQKVLHVLEESINNCDQHRRDEGSSIEKQFVASINAIEEELNEISKIDKDRLERIKNRIKENLSAVIEEEQLDENRLEQELVFYIEKLDISEEKTRLKTHLDYFLDTMDSKESQGKKLNFIAQEIGREINTIGSKANDATIQKKVVIMKDELEKIKEQVLNVL
ncbi:MAG: YicC/YloC family endoribonuclease [Candidatus Cyclobacteriaceae bacterium M2_1C_046]